MKITYQQMNKESLNQGRADIEKVMENINLSVLKPARFSCFLFLRQTGPKLLQVSYQPAHWDFLQCPSLPLCPCF